MVVHPALSGFSRSANKVVCVVFAETLLPVEANFHIKCSDYGLAWIRGTKKCLCFFVKPYKTHSFEAVQVSPTIVHSRHILSFVVTKSNVKQLSSLAMARGINRARGSMTLSRG